jgi:hypothetical protein
MKIFGGGVCGIAISGDGKKDKRVKILHEFSRMKPECKTLV